MGWPSKHVSRLYSRIRRKKGHSIAVGAVARHLSEAAFWILTKQEPYREPDSISPRRGQRGPNLSADRRACVLETRELIATPLLKMLMPH